MADNDLRPASAVPASSDIGKATEEMEAGLWPGLAPLDLDDAERIFGREKELDRLIRLFHRSQFGQTPIVWLTGDAGVGKTSLVMAGLLPRLEGEPGGDLLEWISLDAKGEVKPEVLMDSTVSALLRRTIARENESGLDLEGRLRQFRLLMEQDGAEAVEYVASCYRKAADLDPASDSSARCLVFIDDWNRIPEDQSAGLEKLMKFLRELSLAGCFPCVIAMRSAGFPKIKAAAGAAGLEELGTEVPLGPLEFNEVKGFFESAPSERSESGVMGVKQELLEALVAQCEGGTPASGLPFISETLRRLSASDPLADEISLSDAHWAGGVRETFAEVAESVMRGVPEHDAAFFDLMTALHPVERFLDESGERLRHLPRSAVFQKMVTDPGLRTLVDALVDSRILSLTGPTPSEIRIAWTVPNGLLKWERARQWLEENDRLLSNAEELDKAREAWEAEHRTPVKLLHSTRMLADADELVTYHRRRAVLSDALKDYLEESIRFDRQLSSQWSRQRFLRWLLVGGGVLVVILILIVAMNLWY